MSPIEICKYCLDKSQHFKLSLTKDNKLRAIRVHSFALAGGGDDFIVFMIDNLNFYSNISLWHDEGGMTCYTSTVDYEYITTKVLDNHITSILNDLTTAEKNFKLRQAKKKLKEIEQDF